MQAKEKFVFDVIQSTFCQHQVFVFQHGVHIEAVGGDQVDVVDGVCGFGNVGWHDIVRVNKQR